VTIVIRTFLIVFPVLTDLMALVGRVVFELCFLYNERQGMVVDFELELSTVDLRLIVDA